MSTIFLFLETTGFIFVSCTAHNIDFKPARRRFKLKPEHILDRQKILLKSKGNKPVSGRFQVPIMVHTSPESRITSHIMNGVVFFPLLDHVAERLFNKFVLALTNVWEHNVFCPCFLLFAKEGLSFFN